MIEKDIIFLKKSLRDGQYVYHGSPKFLKTLAPKQAYSFGLKDGEPAVFASSEIQIPMFMSLFDPIPEKEKKSCGVDDDFNVKLQASNNILKRINSDSEGYVYVLEKKYFKLHDHHEWTSESEVVPTFYIRVRRNNIDVKITEII